MSITLTVNVFVFVLYHSFSGCTEVLVLIYVCWVRYSIDFTQ